MLYRFPTIKQEGVRMKQEIIELLEEDLSSQPQFVMDTAAEALGLLAQYSMDFKDREEDRDALASMLRIIAYYLHSKANIFDKAE